MESLKALETLLKQLPLISTWFTKFIKFIQATLNYAGKVVNIFLGSAGGLPALIIGGTILWSVFNGGLMGNWKKIVGAIVIGFILSGM